MSDRVAFLSLKTVEIYGVDFGNKAMVSLIVKMIRGSPNMQRLVTKVSGTHMYERHPIKFQWLFI